MATSLALSIFDGLPSQPVRAMDLFCNSSWQGPVSPSSQASAALLEIMDCIFDRNYYPGGCSEDGIVLLDWYEDGCLITFGVDENNPDWSFLDNWDVQEVEAFYEAHAYLPVGFSLAEYLDNRRTT